MHEYITDKLTVPPSKRVILLMLAFFQKNGLAY